MTEQSIANWLTQFRSASQFEDRYRALQAIIRLLPADEAVTVVRIGLDDSDSVVRAGASRWLATQAGSQPPAGPAEVWQSIAGVWQKLLADSDPDVRFEAARGLIRLDTGNRAAAARLSELLNDEETQPAMLAAILELFSSLSSEEVPAPHWPRFLQHEQSAVREKAAQAVGRWGRDSRELGRELLLLLNDDDPFVREESARSLGAIQVADAAVLAALQTATSDDDEIVAAAAKLSLQQLQG